MRLNTFSATALVLFLFFSNLSYSQILNGDFEESGDTSPVHWRVRTLNGTEARVISQADGNRAFSLYTNSISSNTRPWDARLIQTGVEIQRDRPRQITARVRVQGAESGAIRLAVFGEGNTSLADTGDLLVSNEWQTINVQIPASRVPLPASLAAEEVVVYFMLAYSQNIGSYLEIDDVGYDLRGSLIANSGFDMRRPNNLPAGWQVTNIHDNSAYVTSDIGIDYENAFVTDLLVTEINSLNSGDNPWAQRLFQRRVEVQRGMRYRFSFDAWSSNGPASFRAAIFTPSLEPVFDSQSFSIDANPRRISFEFVGGDSSEVIPYFMYGYQENVGQRIFLDNVRIEKVNDFNRVANGNFNSFAASGDATDWSFTGLPSIGAVAQNSPSDRFFVVNVAPGQEIPNPWAVRLVQQSIRLESESYTLSLRVRSDNESALFRAALFDNSLNSIIDSQQLAITNEWQTLSFPFDLSETTQVMPYLMFGYESNSGAPIYVDDIEIQSENYLRNSDFSLIDQYGQALYWEPWTNEIGTVDFSYEQGTLALTVVDAGSSDMTYSISQSGFATDPDATYRLTFDVQANRNGTELYAGLVGAIWHTQVLTAGEWQRVTTDFSATSNFGQVIFFPPSAQTGDRISLRNIRLTRVVED